MRIALRTLFKRPGYTLLAVLTVSLGVAVVSGEFAFVHAVFLRPTPVPHSEQVFEVYRTSGRAELAPGQFSPADAVDFMRQEQSFESTASFSWTNASLEQPGTPAVRLSGLQVTGDFFRVFQVPAALGRSLGEADDRSGAARVMVLSWDCWQKTFGGDPAILGRTLTVDGQPVAVVGVMPAAFQNPIEWGKVEFWWPISMNAWAMADRQHKWLQIVGRIRPAVTIAEAQAQANALAARFAKDHPKEDSALGFQVAAWDVMRRGGPKNQQLSGVNRGLALFVLLIACANLANLCLARAADRLQEYAVRIALGSGRWRLVADTLAEGLIIGVIGGAAAVFLTRFAVDALGRELVINGESGIFHITVDRPVVICAACATAFLVAVYALSPLWLILRPGLLAAIKAGGRTATGGQGGQRLRHVLVAFELGLALVLIGGAGFFVRATERITQAGGGWNGDNVLTASVVLPERAPYDSPERINTFVREFERQLAALPGATSAVVAQTMPMLGFWGANPLVVEGRPAPTPGHGITAYQDGVTPDYFTVFSIRLRQGRAFNDTDRLASRPVAVINEKMARALWPGQDALGRRFAWSASGAVQWIEVVGVADDVHSALEMVQAPQSDFQVYRPFAQVPANWLNLAIRTSVAPESLGNEVRQVAFRLDPGLALYSVWPARVAIHNTIGAAFGVIAHVIGGFALVGLVLAAIGVYGVVTTFVVQRTTEIGIRMALGARSSQVLRLVLGRTLTLGAIGAGVGFIGAWVVGRILGSILPAVGGSELALVAGAALLMATGVLAAWVPARRATRIAPMVALRSE